MLKAKKSEKVNKIKTYQDVFDNYDIKYIQYFDNVLTAKECKSFIKLYHKKIKKGEGKKGTIGSGGEIDTSRKLSTDIPFFPRIPANDKELQDSLDLFVKRMHIYIAMYLTTTCYWGIKGLMHYLNTNEIPRIPKTIKLSTAGIRMYPKDKGGYFIPHWDRHGNTHKTRVLAIILYLNDIEYGGETIFPVLKERIQPKAGRLLLFPSDLGFLHYGNNAPTKKYILVGHIVDIVDQNITNLEAKTTYNNTKGEKNGK